MSNIPTGLCQMSVRVPIEVRKRLKILSIDKQMTTENILREMIYREVGYDQSAAPARARVGAKS